MAISHVKTNGVADFTGTVTVFNSQGSTTTAAATDLLRPSDWNSVHNQYLTLTGNTLGASTLSGTNLVIGGGNNITLSQVNATRVDIVGANTVAQTVESNTLGISNLGNSAGTSGVVSGGQVQVLFAGGNNVTLSQSLNGSSATITISGANTVAQTNQTLGLYASSQTTGQSSSSTIDARSLTLVGQGIVSAGLSGGSLLVSATVPVQTVESQTLGISNLGNSAGTSGVASGGQVRVLFAGGNNVTLSQSLDGASATITVSGANIPAQTVESQTLGISNLGNSAGTSGVASGGQVRMLFAGGNNVTLSQSINGASGTITISGANIPAQTVESNTFGISNLGNTAGTSGVVSAGQVRVLFAGGNNITVSQSTNGASATITISGPNTAAQTNQTLGLYASSQTYGQSSSSTVDARSLTIVGQGLVSAGLSAGSLLVSASAPAQTNQTLGLYASSQTTAQSSSSTVDARSLTIVGQGGISVGLSGGSFIISQTGGGAQSNQTLGGYFTGNTTGQSSSSTYDARSVSISALGGVSAGMSGGMQIISGPSVSSLVAGNNVSLSSNGSTVSIKAMAAAVSIGGNSTSAGAGYSNVSSGTVVLAGGNNVTLSQNGATVTISAGAAGTINQTGPNIAAGTQTATSGTVVFSNSNNVTFGMSNNSVVTASASFNQTQATIRGYLAAAMDREWLAAQIGNQQCFVQPLNVREAIQFEEINEFVNYSAATNSSNSASLSLYVGIYTRNVSTLSLVTSASQSFAVTNSGTVGSYSIYGGMREYAIPLTTTLTPDNYWIAFLSRTATGGGAGMSWSNFVASNINSAYSGRFSSANNATNQFYMGMGSYNTTTTAIPGSIGFNQINGSAAVNNRPVIFNLASQDLN